MTCATCSAEFTPVRSDQKHCTTRCRNVAAMRAWRSRRGAKRTWPERICRACSAPFAPTHQRLTSCPGCREEREKARRQKRIAAGKVTAKIRRDCARRRCGKEFVTPNSDRWFCCDNCRWLSSQLGIRRMRSSRDRSAA